MVANALTFGEEFCRNVYFPFESTKFTVLG
jgi:hypothetical protein